MKIADNINGGFVAGDTCLHKLRPEVKIIMALFLIGVSGIGSGRTLAIVGMVSLLGVVIAGVPVKNILYLVRRMAWFFVAIAIFPVLFTPGFYLDLPAWFPISISHEGLVLGIESSARLINILLISLVLVHATSDWMDGLERLLGSLTTRVPVIKDLFEVGLLSVKFLPQIIGDTEQYFSALDKKEGRWGYEKIRSFVHFALQFIVEVFSDLDRWSTEKLLTTDRKPLNVNDLS
jgi:energy-coupling factor transporter transmembrane protein EcfT